MVASHRASNDSCSSIHGFSSSSSIHRVVHWENNALECLSTIEKDRNLLDILCNVFPDFRAVTGHLNTIKQLIGV